MTHGAIALIFTLVIIIIGLLGVGGGKMWGEKKVNAKVAALEVKLTNSHAACKEARMEDEKTLKGAIESLNATLKKDIQPRLIVGNFIMDALAEKVGVSKEQLQQIRTNVANGTLKDL